MEVRPIDGNALIEWFSPYLHTDEPIPADVVIEDIRSMPTLTPPNEPLKLEDAKKERYIWFTPLFQSTHPARGATANFTKEQRVCLAQFAYLHKGKKAEHTKTNAPMLH